MTAKAATDAELDRVKIAITRNYRSMASKPFRQTAVEFVDFILRQEKLKQSNHGNHVAGSPMLIYFEML